MYKYYTLLNFRGGFILVVNSSSNQTIMKNIPQLLAMVKTIITFKFRISVVLSPIYRM